MYEEKGCHTTMFCVGPMRQDVTVTLMLVVMVLSLMVTGLIPLTVPGPGIRTSTEADLGEMPTFATFVILSYFIWASPFALLMVFATSITLSFLLQFANIH